jgi:FkbH-like protein
VVAHPDAAGAAIRSLVLDERPGEAWELARAHVLTAEGTAPWSIARNVLRAGAKSGWSAPVLREIRLGVLCSYESAELAAHLRLACLALGIGAECYVAPYGQLEQELLGGDTALARFQPTHVLIAPTAEDLGFPELAEDPQSALSAATQRWSALWERAQRDHGARVIQHGFVVPDETPLGHLSMRLPGSRISLVRALNARLAEAAADEVLLVDCERIAARIGKRQFVDPRLWYAARQPFGHAGLPLIARETAAVLAADLGLAARCLVVDLDNTLWGGIVGEEGPDGIAIGEGPDGEAFAAFQEYLRALQRRGMILAVASKNDLEAAREPFERNPGMRLRLEDFAVFVADWRRKPEQIKEIAQQLGIGLQSILFADDNPAECTEVAAALPEVSTVRLDVPASELVRTLASSPRLELAALSRADADRQRSYAARAQAAQLRSAAGSLEDFWRSLEMRARVRPLDDGSLDRAAQLTQKTNQFNLTLHRHTRAEIERLASDEGAICLTLELDDRFASHGLIGLGFAVRSDEDRDTAVIDTLLLSCRVIGRTAEAHLLSHVGRAAAAAGYRRLRGVYVPGPRNALVSDVYPKLGFEPAIADGGADGGAWEYDLEAAGPIESPYIADES